MATDKNNIYVRLYWMLTIFAFHCEMHPFLFYIICCVSRFNLVSWLAYNQVSHVPQVVTRAHLAQPVIAPYLVDLKHCSSYIAKVKM